VSNYFFEFIVGVLHEGAKIMGKWENGEMRKWDPFPHSPILPFPPYLYSEHFL
jgi:hypothetical protein